jgi:GTPase
MSSIPIRIGLVGNVNSGKSSFIGVMTKLEKGEYDDGRGYARSKITNYRHEVNSGNTSSISKCHTKIDEKTIEFIDLAGHEKYLKTTVSGLCGHQLNYVFQLVAANDGFIGTSEEHFKIVMGLKIPLAIVVTKIDMAPSKKIKQTISEIKDFIRKKSKRHIWIVSDPLNMAPPENMIPLFMISNKTGLGFDQLNTFISKIPYSLENSNKFDKKKKKFCIHYIYSVPGIGKVLYGVNLEEPICKGDKLFLGPNSLGNFISVVVKSVHDDDRNEIEKLNTQMTGCLAIRSNNKNKELISKKVHKGMILLSDTSGNKLEGVYTKIECKVLMYHHATIVRKGFCCTIHTDTIRQCVEIINLENQKRPDKDYLATGDYGKIVLKFKQKPEWIKLGRRFMLRDSRIIGMGIIVELLN